jgi:hypothetical protein
MRANDTNGRRLQAASRLDALTQAKAIDARCRRRGTRLGDTVDQVPLCPRSATNSVRRPGLEGPASNYRTCNTSLPRKCRPSLMR